MAAPSCWRVPPCVYGTWAVLRRRDTVSPCHHGRWHAVGAVTFNPATTFSPATPDPDGCRNQFDEPFVLDTTKHETAFAAAGTPLAAAIAATVAWYRTQNSTP